MTINRFFLAGMVSAALLSVSALSNSLLAQTKKPGTPAPKSTPGAKAQTTSSVALTTPIDSLSYSIGVNIAQSIQQQGLSNVNAAALTIGLQDALKGQKMQLSAEQAGRVLSAYMEKQYAQKMAESQKVADANKKAGDAFLAENKAKPGVVTTASGLQYQIVKEGTGPKPTATDKVKAHYTGRLLDGTVFDSSEQRGQPIEIPVTGVIQGWVEALQLMPVGSKWKLFIPGNLAYGERGTGGGPIGPNATLIFDIELLEIVK